MKRLFNALLATAFLLSSAMLGASAASNSSMMTTHHSKMKHSCPAGEKWVKGYHTKSGKYVHGYCRKAMTK